MLTRAKPFIASETAQKYTGRHNMDCKEFREILDLYIDDELSPEASTAARLHLKECSRCRKVETELLRVRSALKLIVSEHQPPPELVNAVHRLSQSPWRKLIGSLSNNSARI